MRGGSKPGERRGGRQPGTRNKKTDKTVAAAAAGGEMPLEFMLRVMRDEGADMPRREAMAKAAAPYCHAALKAVEHDFGKKTGDLIEKVVRQIVRPHNPNG